MNYDYSYQTTYQNKNDNKSYQYDFCRVFLTSQYDDHIIVTQEKIYDKFSNNTKFKTIIDSAIENGFNLPLKLDNKTAFTFLFNYHFFHYTHKCLQDLFKNNDISTDNYDNLIKLLKIIKK